MCVVVYDFIDDVATAQLDTRFISFSLVFSYRNFIYHNSFHQGGKTSQPWKPTVDHLPPLILFHKIKHKLCNHVAIRKLKFLLSIHPPNASFPRILFLHLYIPLAAASLTGAK